jgi:hypothetical protein
MKTYQKQIIGRLEALSNMIIDGYQVGEISLTYAAKAVGQSSKLLSMLLVPGKDPWLSSVIKAAETLGVDASAIMDENADMGDFEKWPAPEWVNSIIENKKSVYELRSRRIQKAIDDGRPTGICSDCGNNDSLIGNKKLCGACYQRARRAKLAAVEITTSRLR